MRLAKHIERKFSTRIDDFAVTVVSSDVPKFRVRLEYPITSGRAVFSDLPCGPDSTELTGKALEILLHELPELATVSELVATNICSEAVGVNPVPTHLISQVHQSVLTVLTRFAALSGNDVIQSDLTTDLGKFSTHLILNTRG